MSDPVSVDAYLAAVPAPHRTALADLRAAIRAAAPEADEVIAYAMPGYRLDGRYLVGFAAARRHCSFHAGKAPIEALAAELDAWDTHKGTIRFRPDRPLPADLVARLVRARLAERGGR